MQELLYCQNLQCKLPNKIFKSLEEYLESDHNGHKIKKVSLLREDLHKKDQKFSNKTSKDDLYSFIDELVDPIIKVFSIKLTQKLRLFVDENFILSNDFLQLLNAILNNNQNEILMYSGQLDYILNYDQEKFKKLNMVNEEIKKILEQSVQLTSVHVQDEINQKLEMILNQLNLDKNLRQALNSDKKTSKELKQELMLKQRLISKETKQPSFTQTDLSQFFKQFDKWIQDRKKINQQIKSKSQNQQISFEWSDICISNFAKFFGKTTQSLLEFYTPCFFYMKQQMDYKEIKTAQLKLHSCSMIYICDLNILKFKCPDFVKTHSLSFGTFSHSYGGCNY